MTPTDDLVLRRADATDAGAIAAVHVAARRAAPMPDPVHPDDVVRRWLERRLATDDTWVAERDGVVLGYLRATPGWLDDLYVAPDAVRQGIGSALLGLARSLMPDGFCLWVFESNRPARDFYRRHGLVELETTDGGANEAGSPDIRVVWPGTDPLGFLRSLIDEVDDQLGELLSRRTRLTGVVQAHKAEPSRDPDREREVVARLAARAPELGEERVARIVHAIITESLDASR